MKFSEDKLTPYLQESNENDFSKQIIKEDKFTKFDKWLND